MKRRSLTTHVGGAYVSLSHMSHPPIVIITPSSLFPQNVGSSNVLYLWAPWIIWGPPFFLMVFQQPRFSSSTRICDRQYSVQHVWIIQRIVLSMNTSGGSCSISRRCFWVVVALILFYWALSINPLFLDTLFSSVCSTLVPSGYVAKSIYPLDFACCFLPLSVVVYPCTYSYLPSRYHASMLVCYI